MARRLETLAPGTPVFVGTTRVGDVRGVYAEGEALLAELLVVRWDSRGDDVAIPTSEVQSVDDHGVILMNTNPGAYADLSAFSSARFPTVRKLS